MKDEITRSECAQKYDLSALYIVLHKMITSNELHWITGRFTSLWIGGQSKKTPFVTLPFPYPLSFLSPLSSLS